MPSEALTHSIRSSPVSIGPAESIKVRMTSDFGTLLRRAHRVRRAARFLSSFTVIVGMVIHRYYHADDLTEFTRAVWDSVPGRVLILGDAFMVATS